MNEVELRRLKKRLKNIKKALRILCGEDSMWQRIKRWFKSMKGGKVL